ncbi:capsular exopolysaccharide synthesis family protein [Breznakibacter xylanolyticus]|uniref:Capsular exopolysaccharide synthesis family protein n=1 Tax=Breznakibacter xylanolyticus TaxID=990 RepID=A0A2W7NC40_9BACT|nr:polysaccharide biosynthesis tyrosine autokinase [Breznakibacter xylanolyticus]PZX14294.1 capsular exopolysaccharide synthesis family protein [Breznakibacter xylanolyticus]
MSELGDFIPQKEFNLKKTVMQTLKYWYYIPIVFVVALLVSLYVLKTTTPAYRINCKVLISGSNDGKVGSISGASDLPGIILGTGQSSIENQLIILTSNKQIEKTLRQLDFGVSYYRKDFGKVLEIYKNSPFKVIVDTTVLKRNDIIFEVKFLSKDEFTLRLVDDDATKPVKYRFFEKINEPGYSFSIVPVEENLHGSQYDKNTYLFKFNSLRRLVGEYKGKLQMTRVMNGSSIVELSVVEGNVQKGVDFLNRLSVNAVNYSLERKNLIATNTIQFIEKELMGVSDSLVAAEKVLENFRSRNEVMDVSMQGQMIIKQSQDLENQRASVAVRLDYYNYLIDYITNNRDVQEMMFPSAMGVDDPMLTQLINELSSRNAEKAGLQFNSKVANPRISQIDHRIQQLKTSILENTKSVIATTNLTLRDLDKRLMDLSYQIRKLPKTEQLLVNIERKFQLSNEMYTFLLQRRSEAQLAKAANLPDHEIIEEAAGVGKVAPDVNRIMIIMFLVGLLLPAVVIFLMVYFNGKVQDKEDVELITRYPILGQIPYSKKSTDIQHVLSNPRSSLAEAFRSVRTSLGFFHISKTNQTFLITSIIPGEGKSFCALNLAASYAQMGKRTVLIGFDLRKPALELLLKDIVSERGITDFYLSDESTDPDVVSSGIPNLDILFSGPVPPNPAELIAGGKTAELFDYLKSNYEIVVVDSPPVGLVSDAHLLAAYSDLNILVVRHDFTPKAALKQLLSDEKVVKSDRMSVMVNALPCKNGGYAYMYGYGEGYYSSN